MSAPDRRAMLDRADKALSVRRQCALLGVARSGASRALKPANDNDAALMRRIDELFTAWPFLGSRRMTAMLRAEGVDVNRKRVQRLMRLMGIARARAEAENEQTRARPPDLSLSPAQSDDRARKPRLGGRHHLQSDRAGLSPSGGDYRLGVARGACWRLSNTIDVSFCLAALEEALAKFGRPEIFNTDSPGLAVHLGRLHRRARRSRRRDLDGRPRPLDGQRVHPAAVALAEVRGRLSQGLRRRPGTPRAVSPSGSPSTTPHQNTHLSMPLKERGFAGRGLILWGIGPCDARVQRGL